MYVCIYIYIYIYIYICCFFRFDANPKKFFVSCHYHILFVCLATMLFRVNTTSMSIIILLKHCTLHQTYFALQY